jgi:hypothetical protein
MSKTSWVMFFIGVAAVLGLIIFYALGYAAYTTDTTPPPPADQTPEQISVNGVWECLPHRGNGPHTMECAFGVAVDNSDAHYALDLSAFSAPAPFDMPTGTHVKVEGVNEPKNDANSGAFTTYDIDGIIGVTNITKI